MFEDFQKPVDAAPFVDLRGQGKVPAEGRHPAESDVGLTPRQRFTVAILVLMMTAVIGVLFLLASAKIVPPFLG